MYISIIAFFFNYLIDKLLKNSIKKQKIDTKTNIIVT